MLRILRNFVGYMKTNVHYIGKFHYHFSLKFGPFKPGIQTSLLMKHFISAFE